MWVIKLGGSLARSVELKHWLSELHACRTDQIVVVPGGGEFADLVRDYAVTHELSDQCCHPMALRAMEQYGLMLSDIAPILTPVHSVQGLMRCLASDRIPLFMPVSLLAGNPQVPTSWTFTSDSIAAWLATQIGASDLLLVKSVPPENNSSQLQALMAAGIVDPVIKDYINVDLRCWWAGPLAHSRLGEWLRCPSERAPHIAKIQR